METEYLLTPMKFTQRINKYAIVPFHFKIFFEHSDLKKQIQSRRMEGFDELSEQFAPSLSPGKTANDIESYKTQLLSSLEAYTQKEVDEYLPILYNQALVMIITVFDVFLYESLKVATNKHPQLLKSMADEKDMTIVQIIDMADYQSIFERIQDRVLKRFDYKGIMEKMDALKKMRVAVDDALGFKFHKKKVQQQYPQALKMLRNNYDKRHAIVHREQHTFDTYEQLEEVARFFNDLVLSLALALGFRFDIMTDFEKLVGSHPKRSGT